MKLEMPFTEMQPGDSSCRAKALPAAQVYLKINKIGMQKNTDQIIEKK